jgi:hypothetical protein
VIGAEPPIIIDMDTVNVVHVLPSDVLVISHIGHDSLDGATDGFMNKLATLLGVKGVVVFPGAAHMEIVRLKESR